MLKPASPFLLPLALALCSGCRKEPDLRKDLVPVLDPFLFLEADSSCIMVPNILTANGDGINDQVIIIARNMQELAVSVIDQATGQILFFDSIPAGFHVSFPMEGPLADEQPGRLTVQVQGTTISGVEMSGSLIITVVGDLSAHCVSDAIPAVFGDQLDPRRCGSSYPTNDGVCFQ